jgi:hypothetical protein
MKKAASQPPFCVRDLDILLADVAPAVFALEPRRHHGACQARAAKDVPKFIR